MRIEPPSLANETWRLRSIDPSDARAWFAYLSIAAVVEHTSWNVRDVDDLRRIIDACESSTAGSPIRFCVVNAADGTLAGTIGFPIVSAVNRTAELAYDFHPSIWGRGLATLCCRAVSTWAPDALGYVRVQATTLDTNVASRRVVEKSGFAFEGTLRNFRMVRDRPRDFHLFARTS